MQSKISRTLILLSAPLWASPTIAEESTQAFALQDSPQKVSLLPGECASTVTGQHKLRWFCAEGATTTGDNSAALLAKLETARKQAGSLQAENALLKQQLADVESQIAGAHAQVKATRSDAERDAVTAAQRITDLNADNQESARRLTEATEQQQQLRTRLDELQQQLDSARSQSANNERGRQSIEAELKSMQTQLKSTRDDLASSNTAYQTAQARIGELEKLSTSCETLLGDADKDGVFDPIDLCADTERGKSVGKTGCANDTEIVLQGVGFPLNSTRLTGKSRQVLNDVATRLAQHPDIRFEVGGHTDSTGGLDYNAEMSNQRANTVRDYLIAKGVDANRLVAVGYGADRPVAANDSTEGRARNRRVTLTPMN